MLQKYCDNYNDVILRQLESKIKSLDIEKQVIETKRSAYSFLVKGYVFLNAPKLLLELKDEFAVLCTYYSMAIGKYNIHFNKYAIVFPGALAAIYPEAINNIRNATNEASSLVKDISNIIDQTAADSQNDEISQNDIIKELK
jgi:hypothetical protein